MKKTSIYSLSCNLILFIFAFPFFVHAQDTTNTLGNVSIASPTAASLGKYGDIPVSYNTGIPQIGIPIYTAESGPLKLPISLSYHASGLKVQENASWVGAGWSLNAGGVITRTVIGGPDDRGVSSYNICQYGHYSDYGLNNYQWVTGSGFGVVNGMVADDHNFETGLKDSQPDLYFFNFGPYSGKFYFNDDRTPIFVPEEDFKVVPDLNNTSTGLGFQGFVVTTPDGVSYYFGRTGNNGPVDPVEITIASTLQNGPAIANEAVSSWFLNKIVSADKMDSITLAYTTEQFSYYTMAMYPVTNVQTQNIMSPANNGYNVVKNFVQGVRLTGISFPSGSVAFAPASSPRTDLSGYAGQAFTDGANTQSFSLGSIQIFDNKGFCKKDSLYYGYFFDSTPLTINSGIYGGYNIHSDAYRLRLDSIQELSCDATLKIPPYKFTYFTELVPRKLSFGMDHWGFSNGILNNQTLVPTYTLFQGNDVDIESGGNRESSWPAMRGGSLQKIFYPTGGYNALNFEPNDTYVQYNTYSNFQEPGANVGYGTTDPQHFSFTTSSASDTYKLSLSTSNQTSGSGDNLQLSDALGNVVVNDNVPAGTTSTPYSSATYYFTLTPNTTYNGTFYDNSPAGGTASASIVDEVVTSHQGNVIVGGLRIKSDTVNDGLTFNNMIKTYAYTNGGTSSSGILYSRPVYVQSIRNDIFGFVYSGLSVNGCETPDFINPLGGAGNYFISSGSITPMATMQGNHIGYNQVQVSEANNGYSIYRYYGSNIWDNLISDVCTRVINTNTCSLSIPNFPAPPQPFEIGRGDLKYEGVFRQDGKILRDATYNFSYSLDPIGTPGIIYTTLPGTYSYTPYQLQSAKKTQTQVVSTIYDPVSSGAVTTTNTTYYGSSFHHKATKNVMSTSTGDSLLTTIKYALDFRIPACDAIPDSLPYYNQLVHSDSVVLYSMIATCPPAEINWVCRYDTFQNFRRKMNLARIQYVNYRRRSYSDPTNLLNACYLSNENAADGLLKPILRLQDEFNNPPLETAQYKDSNLLHASLTQYDTSQSPLGYVYPGRMKLVSLQIPSNTFTSTSVSGSTITKDSRFLDESLYKFSAGHPQQVTGHDGISHSYIWDYKNKEPIAKIINATVDQVASTSFEADGTGTWTIGSALRDTTTAITGKISYNLVNGACTRSGLTSASTYIVSYWSKTGTSFTVTGSTATKQGKTITINGGTWTYFEHTVSGTTSVSVTGSGDVDELRLYPSTAQMMTYTYSPLIGMISQCDVDNRVTYYTYDGLGRLRYTRDQDGNITKTLEYHYASPAGSFY